MVTHAHGTDTTPHTIWAVVSVTVLLVVGVTWVAFAAETGVPCHNITSPTATSTKYGSPIDLFGSLQPFITASCTKETTTISIGSGTGYLVYKTGYQYVNGVWKKISFTGSKQSGSWFVGNASASVIPALKGKEGKVLAYVCQQAPNGAWKCGCVDNVCASPKWQLQTYKNYQEAVASAGTGDGFVEVYYPSTYNALPEQTVTINGAGFELKPVHTVSWNGKETQKQLSSTDGKTIKIAVPNLPAGKYEVEIAEKAAAGTGSAEHNTTVVWIGSGSTQKPIIEKITPTQLKQGDTVTVYGSGFTRYNNDVISTFGVVGGLESKDGKTITFVYNPFPEQAKFYNEKGQKIPVVWDVHLTVFNTSGTSNSKSFKFNL